MPSNLRKTTQALLTVLSLVMVFLYFFAESNYIQNKNLLFGKASIIELVLSSLALLFILWSFPSKSQTQWIRKLLLALKSILIFIVLFMAFAEAAMVDFSGMLFGPEAIAHFSWDAFMLGVREYFWPFLALLIFLVLIVFILVYSSQKFLTRKTQWWVFVISALLLVYFFNHSVLGRYTQGIKKHLALSQLQTVTAKQLDKLKPLGISALTANKSTIVTKGGNNKNLIVVYLESFSDIFTTSDRYPELTPNINRLKASHGPIKPYISTAKFTMDGLISSLCGFLPNMTLGNNTIAGNDKHYFLIPCLPDVLKEAGYYQEFFGGAKKSFANKGTFLLDHGFDQVWGWEDFEHDENYKPPKKHSWWGLHDDDLFALAHAKIKELHQKTQPFHISILTLSSHLKGFSAPSCQPYGNDADRFIDAIHCTDQLLGQFIDQLKSDGILEDTVVFITGDHSVFNTSLTKSLFGDEIRNKDILGIMVDLDPVNNNLPMGLYDMAPVLLDRLAIDHNVTFINGQSNEFSSERLLITRSQVFQNGLPVPLSTTCKVSDEYNSDELNACTHRKAINTLHGYTQLFKLDQSLKYQADSTLRIDFSQDKDLIQEIALNGKSIKTQFTRNGFKLNGKNFNSQDIFYIQFDTNKKTISHTFLLDQLRDPIKTINYLNKHKPAPFLVFGLTESLNPSFKERLNGYRDTSCLDDHFCFSQLGEIGGVKQNKEQTEFLLKFKH